MCVYQTKLERSVKASHSSSWKTFLGKSSHGKSSILSNGEWRVYSRHFKRQHFTKSDQILLLWDFWYLIFDLFYSMTPCTNWAGSRSVQTSQAQARVTEPLPKESSWDFWEELVFVWWHSCSTSQASGGLFGNAPPWAREQLCSCATHFLTSLCSWGSSRSPTF